MFIGINKDFRIKQIADTAEGIVSPSLTVIEVDRETTFGNWTDRRILAYCYKSLESGYSIYPGRDLTQVIIEDNREKAENDVLELSATVVELEYERLMEVIENV